MDIGEESRRVFLRTGKHFADYYSQYAKGHARDWPALQDETSNLLAAAQDYDAENNYADLLALR